MRTNFYERKKVCWLGHLNQNGNSVHGVSNVSDLLIQIAKTSEIPCGGFFYKDIRKCFFSRKTFSIDLVDSKNKTR